MEISKSYLSGMVRQVLILTLNLAGLCAANAQINCTLVEGYGNSKKASLLEQVNDNVAGLVYDDIGATKLKKLEIEEARNIDFDGCKITLELRVKLHRKLRRDANGTIVVSGYITKAQFYGRRYISIQKATIDRVRLSRTLRIGEKFYKWVANRTFPGNQVFYL